jgi:hypothetical protein
VVYSPSGLPTTILYEILIYSRRANRIQQTFKFKIQASILLWKPSAKVEESMNYGRSYGSDENSRSPRKWDAICSKNVELGRQRGYRNVRSGEG